MIGKITAASSVKFNGEEGFLVIILEYDQRDAIKSLYCCSNLTVEVFITSYDDEGFHVKI